jgi:hypothetical protein
MVTMVTSSVVDRGLKSGSKTIKLVFSVSLVSTQY